MKSENMGILDRRKSGTGSEKVYEYEAGAGLKYRDTSGECVRSSPEYQEDGLAPEHGPAEALPQEMFGYTAEKKEASSPAGILDRIGIRKNKNAVRERGETIDLSDHPLVIPEESGTRVKVMEIRTIDDLTTASDLVYKGNILFIRCALPEDNRKGAMDTIASDLKRIAKDCGGDMVIISDTFILMTANGVKIDNMVSKRKNT
jgi:SepF-like predicted cell division protein (DUF552 family)